MAKPDFPALLLPGMQPCTLSGVHSLAVAPYPNDAKRAYLYQQLCAWVSELQALGVKGTLWMDGSFMTEKPDPSDIDCVLWFPAWASGRAQPSQLELSRVQKLLDKPYAEKAYGIDLYVENPDASDPQAVFNREAYWRGVLGFGHDRMTAKGFAEVTI